MIPWVLLGEAIVPEDGSHMRLHRRGDEYAIRVGNIELMNSRVHGSEDELASIGCGRLKHPATARVLVGGLGMGFTLAAVLRELGPRGEAFVSELVPEVVEWNRGPLGEAAGNPLRDPRVTILQQDVVKVIKSSKDRFDAILLDVDNGPSALTSKGNNWLYTYVGLRGAHAALKQDGILAIWSANSDDAFTRRLHETGFRSEVVRVRGRGKDGGARFVIWVAARV